VHADASSRLPEADQLCVRPSPRREALRRDVQRLQQVGLADAVRTDGENEPRLERDVEPLVRPVLREMKRLDDQARRARKLSRGAGSA
jgi:hypothetical protein